MNPLIGNTRLLSEEQFVNLAKRPYNPFWLDQVGFSETDQTTLLLGFNSKIKIDELIRGGALIAGDIFRANVAVRIAANSTVTRTVTMEAEVRDFNSQSFLITDSTFLKKTTTHNSFAAQAPTANSTSASAHLATLQAIAP